MTWFGFLTILLNFFPAGSQSREQCFLKVPQLENRRGAEFVGRQVGGHLEHGPGHDSAFKGGNSRGVAAAADGKDFDVLVGIDAIGLQCKSDSIIRGSAISAYADVFAAQVGERFGLRPNYEIEKSSIVHSQDRHQWCASNSRAQN